MEGDEYIINCTDGIVKLPPNIITKMNIKQGDKLNINYNNDILIVKKL